MALLCTLVSTYQPGSTLKIYRKTWRNPIGRAEPALHHIAITGIAERLSVIDPKTKTQAYYHITKEDIIATDWLVEGGKTPRCPGQQFYFYDKLKPALDRNRLITLNGWPEDRYLSANGNNDCFSVVTLVTPTHNDWLATPNELMSSDWYMTERYAPRNITDEMHDSYLDYAMSVITARALPDVRDGFKPVHRRVVYAMHELGNTSSKAYKKSARVVGDVIGKYHPHGDSAVYETIVRMAQDFSLRYPLIDGQGNFGSIDGDSAAAMRYTEVRMQPLTELMLSDLEMDTVEWEANYDGTEQIPVALPTRFPNLVANGTTGIAVGMATNMAPHNLTETINATIALIQNPMLPDDLLLSHIPAPDFPTGGTIRGLKGSRDAILTGRGRIIITSKYHIETSGRGGNIIVFTEIPYTGNKAKIIMKIADLVKEKKLEGISNVQDESDREGLRIAIYCSRDANPDVVLNNLLNGTTDLESSFSVNNRVIVNGVPTVMNMRGLLNEFIAFRREVIIRRTKFQIAKAKVRAHELEGLVVALLNIDQILSLIKASKDASTAKAALVGLRFKAKGIRSILGSYDATTADSDYGFIGKDEFRLSEDQADKIIAMRLSNLTGLEKDRIKAEFFQILEQVIYLNSIINDFNVLNGVLIQELQAAIPRGDKRRTMIDVNEHRAAAMEELIDDEEVVVTMSRQGWIKTQPLKEYSAQRRGGRGKSATGLKDEDYVRLLMTTTKHQTIMLFTTHGRVHWVKVWELPEGSRGARGKPVQNFIQLNEGEEVTALLPVREFGNNDFVFMVSRQGQIKRVHLTDFSNVRSQGIIAMGLDGDDQVVGCQVTDGTMRVMLFSSDGKAIHFEETQVRAMGRSAKGVRGMTLPEGSSIVSLVVAAANGEVLCVCENGYGKRTSVKEFTVRQRGGQGVIAINASPRNGNFVGAVAIKQSSEVMVCTDAGVVIRMDSQMITKASRNTQGVKLINLTDGSKVSAIETIDFVDSGVEPVVPKVKKKTTKK